MSYNYITFNATTALAAILFVALFLIGRKLRQPAHITKTQVRLEASQHHRSASVKQQTAAVYSVSRYTLGMYIIVALVFLGTYIFAPIFNILVCIPSGEGGVVGFLGGMMIVVVLLVVLSLFLQTKFQRQNAKQIETVALGLIPKIIMIGVLVYSVWMLIQASQIC